MSIETMKLALEAHQKNERHRTVAETRYWCEQYKLLAKQAIEQAEQAQPVAWMHTKLEGVVVPHRPADLDRHPDRWEGLHKTPPPRQPLTDEQFLDLILRTGTTELVGVATFVGGSIQMQGKVGLLRSAKVIKEFVEAAHGIKGKT